MEVTLGKTSVISNLSFLIMMLRILGGNSGDNGGREQISPGSANDRFLLQRAAASPPGVVLFQIAPAIFSMIANAIDAANTRNIQMRITFGMSRLFSITNLASSHSSKGRSPISRFALTFASRPVESLQHYV